MSLPVELDGEEILLRSLRKRDVNREAMRVKAGALKPGRSDPSGISLIREAIGADESKTAAKAHVHGDEFWAFGLALCATLERHTSKIEDDRATFYGHANMAVDFVVPAGPPNTPPEMTQAYEDAMLKLIAIATEFGVICDADPSRVEWTGAQLTLAS